MKKSFLSLALIFLFCVMCLAGNMAGQAQTCFATTSNDGFNAKSLYLIDYSTGEVLFERDATEQLPVASIVKLMTIDLVCEEIEKGNLSLEDTVIVSENAQSMGGSQVFIEANGEYSVGDLLKSTIVSSANDASVALAEKICGSEEGFVSLMNQKAKALGLENTHYVNCTGLPAVGQFSCAKDTAILLSDVLKHDDYHKYSTIWMDTLKHPKGRESELVNTNKLIRYFEGCDGGKTGSTQEAGYCLVATAKRRDMRLVGVVLGAENGKDRFAQTSKLLNYGFNNFENKKVVDSTKLLDEKVEVSGVQIGLKAKEDLFILQKRGDDSKIMTKVELNRNLTSPISAGDSVGKIYLLKDGEVKAEADIISLDSVNAETFFDGVEKIINLWKISA